MPFTPAEARIASLFPTRVDLPATLLARLRLVPDALMTIKAVDNQTTLQKLRGVFKRPEFPWIGELAVQPLGASPNRAPPSLVPNFAALEQRIHLFPKVAEGHPDQVAKDHWVWVGATTRCGYFARPGKNENWVRPSPVMSMGTTTATPSKRVFLNLFEPACPFGDFCLNPAHWRLKPGTPLDHPDLNPGWAVRHAGR